MSLLYINSKGYEVRRHSYSAGADFSRCARLYELRRVRGWQEKRESASMYFGRCLESAIQHFHETGCQAGSTAEKFSEEWAKVGLEFASGDPHPAAQLSGGKLTYSRDEGDWVEMLRMGQECAALYEIKLPTLPIRDPHFQVNYRKEVFPGSYLAGLEFTSFLDIVCPPKPSEPGLVIDIKTSSNQLSDAMLGLLSLDPQLRSYAWVSGIPNVAFLWFTKARTELRAGDEVMLLKAETDFAAGNLLTVFDTTDDGWCWLLTPHAYEEAVDRLKGLRGKSREAVKDNIRRECLNVEPHRLTKQRLQFAGAVIPEDVRRETGELIGVQIAKIVAANERGFWPQEGGIRFPNNQCCTCPMRGICANNEKLRDALVYLPGATEERNWIDELEDAA